MSLKFFMVRFGSVQLLSCVQLFATPWTAARRGFPVHNHLPELAQTHVHQVSDAIQPSYPVVPFSFHLQSFPALGSFPMSQFFTSAGQSIGASASASVLSMSIQLISFRMDLLDCLAVQETLESSPTPPFKSINSSALNFLYSPTLTSIHDYWKN